SVGSPTYSLTRRCTASVRVIPRRCHPSFPVNVWNICTSVMERLPFSSQNEANSEVFAPSLEIVRARRYPRTGPGFVVPSDARPTRKKIADNTVETYRELL